MGQDKALLPLSDADAGGSTTLLDFMLHKLEAIELFEKIVICRNEKPTSAAHQYLPDIKPGLGPIGALYTLSTHFPGQKALIVPVDMPLLEPQQLKLLSEVDTSQQAACYYRGYYFPLLIQFHKSVTGQLLERIDAKTPDLSVARLLQDIQATELVAPGNLAQFDNANTAEQWHKVLRVIERR